MLIEYNRMADRILICYMQAVVRFDGRRTWSSTSLESGCSSKLRREVKLEHRALAIQRLRFFPDYPCLVAVPCTNHSPCSRQEIRRHTEQHTRTRPFSIASFSMASLNKILRHFADLDLTRVGIGYGLMVSMLAAVQLWWTDTGFPDSPKSGSVTLTDRRVTCVT